MRIRTFAALLCSLTLGLPLGARAAGDDLSKLVTELSKYESGQNIEPVQKIEQLLRDSVARPALKGELEAAMQKVLASESTFEARRFACQILAVVGTDASLPAVTTLLAKEDTVGIGCLALSGRRSPNVNKALRDALGSARGAARLQLVIALGNHQDPEAVGALAQLAADKDPAVARIAICSLAKIRTPAARAAVAALGKQAPPCAATEATLRTAEQLVAAGDRKGAAAIYARLLGPATPANVRRGALSALFVIDADGGTQRILEILQGTDPVLVPVAIARVSRLKPEGTSQTFAALLPKLAPAAQAWLIEALASRRDAAALAAARTQLSATDAGVRRAAILAVGRLDDASAVPALMKILAVSGSADEQQDVEMALGTLRGAAATDKALVAEMKTLSGDAKIRLFSILARRGARAAVPPLLVEAGGADVATAQAAYRALGRLAAGSDLPAILQKLVALGAADARDDAESAAARAMAKIANPAQRTLAVRAVLAKTSDVEARCSLVRLLPVAADATALAAINAARTDKEPRVRDAAVRALAAWPDTTGWDALLVVFTKPENARHRALALRALVRLSGELNAKPDAALIGRYRQLLAGAASDDDRKLILSTLAGAAHADALELAVPLLSRPAIRAETELAVKKIAAAVQAEHPQAAQAALAKLKQAKRPAPKK